MSRRSRRGRRFSSCRLFIALRIWSLANVQQGITMRSEQPRRHQTPSCRRLEPSQSRWQPPPIQAFRQAGQSHRAASEEGFDHPDVEIDLQAGRLEMAARQIDS